MSAATLDECAARWLADYRASGGTVTHEAGGLVWFGRPVPCPPDLRELDARLTGALRLRVVALVKAEAR